MDKVKKVLMSILYVFIGFVPAALFFSAIIGVLIFFLHLFLNVKIIMYMVKGLFLLFCFIIILLLLLQIIADLHEGGKKIYEKIIELRNK